MVLDALRARIHSWIPAGLAPLELDDTATREPSLQWIQPISPPESANVTGNSGPPPGGEDCRVKGGNINVMVKTGNSIATMMNNIDLHNMLGRTTLSFNLSIDADPFVD